MSTINIGDVGDGDLKHQFLKQTLIRVSRLEKSLSLYFFFFFSLFDPFSSKKHFFRFVFNEALVKWLKISFD